MKHRFFCPIIPFIFPQSTYSNFDILPKIVTLQIVQYHFQVSIHCHPITYSRYPDLVKMSLSRILRILTMVYNTKKYWILDFVHLQEL
jgi:hypothetical protein